MKARKTLRKEAFYPHPPEKVWVGLTDPRALAEWLMPNDFKPVVGHKFVLQVDGVPAMGFSGINECVVLECDPPRRMVWSWVVVPGSPRKERHEPMKVVWTLEPVSGGTRIILEQSGLEHLTLFHRLSMAFGWGTMLRRWIPKVLANVDDGNDFTPGAIPLKKRCYKTKTIPDHLVR